MRKVTLLAAIVFAVIATLFVSGCTTPSTEQAIKNYEQSGTLQQVAFNNSYQTAKDQMGFNLIQYVRSNQGDIEKQVAAISATWKARDNLETARIQYLYGRFLSQVTVGQYLYDQQGGANVLSEYGSNLLNKTSNAVNKANKASVGPIKKPAPTTQPDASIRKRVDEVFGKDR